MPEEKIRLATIDAPQSTWLQQLDHLLVLGFTDFTRQQTDLLQTISTIVPVTLIFDHSMAGRQGLVLPEFIGYEASAEKVLPAPAGRSDCCLNVLQDTLWRVNSVPISLEPDASIRLSKAKGGWRKEVAYLAEEIKRLLKTNPDLSPEQIGLVTPYPLTEVYQILTDSGLPVTVKVSTPLGAEPVAQALLQPYKVILTDFSWTEMINYLRLGGIPIGQTFFSFVPPVTFSGWQAQLRACFEQQPEVSAQITTLLELLGQIPAEGTFEEYLTFCEQWLNHPLLKRRILPARVTPEPYRQVRYWQTALLSKINRLLNETHASLLRLARQKITVQQFYLMLQSLLETERIPLPPPGRMGSDY